MFTPDQLCLQIWILMSFQETLVSKKQKKTKKNTQNAQKTKICKKIKWKTVKFLNFPFSWLQFTLMLPHYGNDPMSMIFQWRIMKIRKTTTIYLNDYKYGLTISLAKIKT